MNSASAKSSLGQVPTLAKMILNLGISVFDYGAGKVGKTDQEFSRLGLRYLPFDPFNRSEQSNQKSLASISAKPVHSIMCANVLNVVDDLAATITSLAEITRFSETKTCYVSVYHKASLPRNRFVKGYIQRNWSPCCYVEFLKTCFSSVTHTDGILICTL